MRVLTVGAQKTSNSSKNTHVRLIDRRCEYECAWLSVSLCQPCSRLTNCPGCTLPPAPWSLGYAPEPPTTLNFISRRKWIGVGFFFSFWREERWKKQQPCKPQGESKIGSNFDYFHFYLFLPFLFYMKAINENNTHEKQISVLLYNTAKTVERVLKSWLINAFGTSCTHLCTCLIPW